MELAWVTGRGPELLTGIENRGPLVRSSDVVAFGYRDHEDQKEYHSQPLPDDLMVLDLPALHEMGVDAAGAQAIAHLARSGLDGFFIHLDADVLDDAIMPAVDFRVPGGLSRDELTKLLRIAVASVKAIGIEVTIYNPTLDADGSAGRLLVDILVNALADLAALVGQSTLRGPEAVASEHK